MPIPVSDTASHLERQSLKDVAAARIASAIFDGTLRPGERLNDLELQQWLGISRTPIREALLDLESFGLIEIEAQRYTRVAVPKVADMTDSLQAAGALIGGIVRMTVPALTIANRMQLCRDLDEILAVAYPEHAELHSKLAWALIARIIDQCGNALMVHASRGLIAGLSYRLALTREDRQLDWASTRAGLQLLQERVMAGDSVGAELAVDYLFLLPESGETAALGR